MIMAYHWYIVQHDTKFALWLIKILVVTKVKYKYRLGGACVAHDPPIACIDMYVTP